MRIYLGLRKIVLRTGSFASVELLNPNAKRDNSIGVGLLFRPSSGSMNWDQEENCACLKSNIYEGQNDGKSTNVVKCLP